MDLEGEVVVKLNVRRHDVTIKDGVEVFINHKKCCKNPCGETESIVTYLQDELFVTEGFFVLSSQDYKNGI